MKNSINTYPYDIAAIILAYLRDEVDEEGLCRLNVWLEESDSHKALFARIQDEGMQYEDIQKIAYVERRSVSELLSDLMLQYREQQKSALSEYEKVRK